VSKKRAILGTIAFLLVLVSAAFGSEEVGPVTMLDEPAHGEDPSVGFLFEEPGPDQPEKAKKGVSGKSDDCGDAGKEQKELPRIAIIIDDMGYHQQIGKDLLGLDLNLTFSFLPHAPFTAEQESLAWQKGHDILVHMPMQPKDSQWDPGPGTLYLDSSVSELSMTIRENLESVPHAIGANNHMGSSFTADRLSMHLFLGQLRNEGLFFVDSLTTPESIGAEEAGKMGIKAGRRQVFLDNVQTEEDICRQLKELIAYARRHGSAIGIGHPNRATYMALTRCRDMLLKQVRVVGVHELVQ